MSQRAIAFAVLAWIAAACGPTHHGAKADATSTGADSTVAGEGLPHTLDSLLISPANQIVQLDLNATGAQAFTVMASYADGTSDDVTSQVTLAAGNPAVGTFTAATLAIPGFGSATAVTSPITATLGTVTATTQLTVVAYRQSGPEQDFFFILPYQDPGGPEMKPLTFSTAIPALDVFLLMDTTGSMAGEIQNLQQALTGTIIPGITTAVANTQFGVGSLQDFPIEPYGVPNSAQDCGVGLSQPDQPLRVLQTITNNTTAVSTAVSALSTGGKPIGCGDDIPEGCQESIYQVATGAGLTGPAPTNVPATTAPIGAAHFRAGTMPVIVAISDAGTHSPDGVDSCVISDNDGDSTGDITPYTGAVAAVAHTRPQTKAAVAAICGRVVGLAATPDQQGDNFSAGCLPAGWMTDLATASGARVPPAAWDVGTRPTGCAETQCCTGQSGAGQAVDADGLCPMVFSVAHSGAGVSASIVTGIQMLTRFATFDVTSQTSGSGDDTSGNPLPTPHTTADFLKTITPTSFVLPTAPPVVPTPTFDATTFHTVTPGTQVSFAVDAFNDFVMQTSQAQIFSATITVLAGGCTPLDQRSVLILVPPAPITIQ